MAKYELYIKGRGRGVRSSSVNAPNLATVRKQAKTWLEHGSEVTVKSPSGKVVQFSIH